MSNRFIAVSAALFVFALAAAFAGRHIERNDPSSRFYAGVITRSYPTQRGFSKCWQELHASQLRKDGSASPAWWEVVCTK